ncbi:MAG: MerC domain-containing protein [Flavobacteriaceae bacterium]|nr:MerC domain-containing protein [Flavobacteriaceae bacterium]
MNFLKLTHKRSDVLGVLSSSFCLIHCLITPFIFIAQVEMQSYFDGWPFWWTMMSFIFITLSFLAVYFSTKNTSKKNIRPFFWTFWGILSIVTINEEIEWYHIPEVFSYAAAGALILTHFYSLKYCRCKDPTCCSK